MARNELMAKHMMQNSNFDDTIKDYNVTIEFMTENLQRGTHEEQNTHTVVTSDFQKLEFPYTMNERHSHHSDEDGISDGAELGNEKWINITEFVKRTYEDTVRKGDPHKATFEAQVEDIIEKNGAYTDFNGNKVYGSVKWNDDKTKVLYRVYDYKSNPKLNDTDFDGLWDNADCKPIDNNFKGNSNGIGRVEYNQDFRWFYTNNQKYNDELAVMSLIMSNLADGNNVNTDQASGDITVYLTSIGFSNIQNIGEYGDNIYIAKMTIQYYDQQKDVIGVFLGKCDRWYSDVIKYKENQKAQVINTAYRESLENYIIRIINKVNLIATSDCSYWVAGYDVGRSIASEISAKLVDTGKEVYAYTFGAFNTRDSLDTKNEIKNLRNEDDFAVKFITGTKPGQNYGASIFENLMFEYRDLTGSSDYNGNYIFTNYLLYVYDKTEFAGTESEETMLSAFDDYMINFNRITNQDVINDFADLCMLMDKWADGNRQAHSIKSYYVLAKSLNGFDLLDGERQEHYDKIDKTLSAPSSDSMVLGFSNTYEFKAFKNDKGQYVNYYLDGYMEIYPNNNEKDIKAYYRINGACDFSYDLPSGWQMNITARSMTALAFLGYQDITDSSYILNSGSKILYKKSVLQDGLNEYEIQLHYVGDSVPSSPICLYMNQHTDKNYKQSGFIYGVSWCAKSNTIYPTSKDTCYKKIWYAPRETALMYYMSLTGSNNPEIKELVARFIQGSINVGVYLTDLTNLAEDVIDYSVNGFTGIVSRYNPVAGGFTKGMWKVTKESYDYYGLLVDPASFVIGKLKDELNLVFNQLVDVIYYKKSVGEAIYVDSVTNSNGEKYIFCDYGLKDCTMVNDGYDCMSWIDFTTVLGDVGVKGDFE